MRFSQTKEDKYKDQMLIKQSIKASNQVALELARLAEENKRTNAEIAANTRKNNEELDALKTENKNLKNQAEKDKKIEKPPPKETKNVYQEKEKKTEQKIDKCGGDALGEASKGNFRPGLKQVAKEGGDWAATGAKGYCKRKLKIFSFACDPLVDGVKSEIVDPQIDLACKKYLN
ncbi:unnamed protein product [Meloidogyne enterolobii]|uniref:Uncharacterized protein n=1 Tax=Meloidogyne enterolobii TaxID=390850 RepID=A0ACB0ZPW6_MELEN